MSLSLGFSSASSIFCSEIYNIVLKISAIKASGVKKYISQNLFLGVREILILESKGYSIGSERVDEEPLGLLVGNSKETSVEIWSGVEKTIIAVIKTLSNRGVLLVV
jgi:hypothetical protein